MSRRVTTADDVTVIPEAAWRSILRGTGRFLLHHPMCGVMRSKDCNCVPLCIGPLFGDPEHEHRVLA